MRTKEFRTPKSAIDDVRLAINGGAPAVQESPLATGVDYSDAADDVHDIVLSGSGFGWYGGPKQAEFESRFAKLVGADYGVMCSSGTEALRLILHAAGVPDDRSVAVPNFAFHSVLSTILSMGARPCLLAVDPSTLVMDVDRAVDEVPVNSIVVAVHAAGRGCDLELLKRARPDLVIIEDAAEAQGSQFGGSHVGNNGMGAIWSFTTSQNPVHTAAVAGMVTTNDVDLNIRLRRLAHYGKDHRSRTSATPLNPMPSEPGYNAMSTELEAAVGCATAKLAPDIWHRQRIAGIALTEALQKRHIEVVPEPEGGRQNYHEVLIRADMRWWDNRDWALDALIAEGCDAWTHYHLSEIPFVRQRMDKMGLWGEREEDIRQMAFSGGPVFGIDPGNRYDEHVALLVGEAVATAVEKIFIGGGGTQ